MNKIIKTLTVCIVLFLLLQVTACGEKIETAKVKKDTLQTDTAQTDTSQDGADQQTKETDNTKEEKSTAVSEEMLAENRLAEEKQLQIFQSKIEEAEASVGFLPLTLPAVTGYLPDSLNILQQEGHPSILEVNYKKAGEETKAFYLRKAEGTEDISGKDDVVYQKKDVNGHTVQIGEAAGGYLSIWTDDTYTYAIVASGIEEDAFYSLVGACFLPQEDKKEE